MSERIAKLKDAIETMHRCKAVHFASEAVVELFRGEVVWDGVVETFDLVGHPKAKRCHAWSYEENGETQFVTVLELPPVDSAETAVKVAIAAESKKEHNRPVEITSILEKIELIRRFRASKQTHAKRSRVENAPDRVEMRVDGEEFTFSLSGNDMVILLAEFPECSNIHEVLTSPGIYR